MCNTCGTVICGCSTTGAKGAKGETGAQGKPGISGATMLSYTTTLRDAIVAPTAGTIIFNSTTKKLNFYDGVAWAAVTSV